MTKSYQTYLRSADWLIKKAQLVNHYRRQKRPIACDWCSSTQDLQVHHRHYRRIFKEKMGDLAFLCRPCHEKETKNKGSFERAVWDDILSWIEKEYV